MVRGPGSGTARILLQHRLPRAPARGAAAAGEDAAPGPAGGRRARQHLRLRGAASRRDLARHAGGRVGSREARQVDAGRAPGPGRGHRCGRLDASRLRDDGWRAGLFPAPIPRLWPRRGALPSSGLRRLHRAHRPRRALDVRLRSLPGMSLVKRLAAIALGLALAGAAGQGAAQPAIWTVRSPTATLVLFGSIHLLPPGLDWRPPALDAALAKADELWFEVPITPLSEGEANSAAESRGALPQGRHLFSLVTPDQADRLRRVAIALHCDPGAIDKM